MADGFVPGFVKWLNKTSKLNTKEGEDGEIVTPGQVYLSPTSKSMEIEVGGKIHLIPKKVTGSFQPSCDVLLSSVASTYKDTGVGIILTGAGNDGTKGIMQIKENHGTTLAQDEKTSLVFGMAKEAITQGSIDRVMPLQDIAPYLNHLAYA